MSDFRWKKIRTKDGLFAMIAYMGQISILGSISNSRIFGLNVNIWVKYLYLGQISIIGSNINNWVKCE